MGFRLLRICSNETSFENRLEELKQDFLIPRSYNPKIIDAQFKRIRELPGSTYCEKRAEALKKKQKVQNTSKRIISPFDYNPLLPKISSVITKHHKAMLFSNPDLKSYFEEPPMSSLRQGPNLRKYLCKSNLAKLTRSRNLKRGAQVSAPGWKKCSKPCPACPYALPPCKSVKSQVSEYTHNIKTPINCQSKNVIYYWKCTKDNCELFPECEYIGMTSRTFQKRLYEHTYYVKSEKFTEPSGEHFNLPGHSLHHLKGLALEEVRNADTFVLKAREALLIQKFNTFNRGLNQEP